MKRKLTARWILRTVWRDPALRWGAILVLSIIAMIIVSSIMKVRAAGWDWDCLWLTCRKYVQ